MSSQAGVLRASVTLVFNNTDPENSPIGYNDKESISVCRQYIVGGTNKYLINGSIAKKEKVDALFASVSLNVNNPHFLIMQGKITKVLNMKPPEILAMIEEAAGTRMFEDRKKKAYTTMEKKDAKLNDITDVRAPSCFIPFIDAGKGNRSSLGHSSREKDSLSKVSEPKERTRRRVKLPNCPRLFCHSGICLSYSSSPTLKNQIR